MKFNKLVEDFNISPKSQNAIQAGPDIGMTTGNINGTFPSTNSTIGGNLLPHETQLTLKKKHAKKLLKLLSSHLKKD
jgi:hypothetical protein